MSAEILFTIFNIVAAIGWLPMLLAPKQKFTHLLVLSGGWPVALCLGYAVIIVTQLGKGQGDFASLAGVAQLFENKFALLAGWVHYLAFDMFIGAWVTRDALRQQINHLLVAPCLVLTFMLGPIGLLFYFLLRVATRENFLIQQNDAD